MKKIYTVAIIGCGSRGIEAYGKTMRRHGGFRVVSLCEIKEEKLLRIGEDFGIPREELFTDETKFFERRRADALVIATQDRDHVRMCIRALELGYDVLLEKPISPFRGELERLLEAHKKYGGRIIVGHVLRYGPVYLKAKKLLDAGTIGDLIRIDSLERVGYWHQAHSFVRGNWNNDNTTSPMIMQKCCHDFDLLQWYANSACERVYSSGRLNFFDRAHMPEGAAARCEDCKYNDTCIYSAENRYVRPWRASGGKNAWPWNVADDSDPITEESLRKALHEGNYGRCVFSSDNNVVDDQSVQLCFENGVNATHVMTAFNYEGGRRYSFSGTKGELWFDERDDVFCLALFGQEPVRESITSIMDLAEKDSLGHGGGDAGIVDAFYRTLSGETSPETTLERSIESHLIAIAAERSRLENAVVYPHAEDKT